MRTPHQLALAWLQGALRHLNRNVDTDAYFRASDEEHDVMMGDDGHWVPRPDDSRLVLAAPDLLEALRGLLEIGKRDLTNPKYDGYFDVARAAIAKAEGTS